MVRLTDLQKVVVVGLLQLCTVKTIITFNFFAENVFFTRSSLR